MQCPWVFIARRLVLLAFSLTGAIAVAQPQALTDDPPARVGALSDIQGSVVWAPMAETEWRQAVPNRPITRGDRLWTDDGARAEVHFGSSVLRIDSSTFVEAADIESDAVQLQLNEGTVNARVRDLRVGESFEIATPHLALRAARGSQLRIDVDARRGFTRIAMRSGTATIQGAGGGAVRQIAGGQVAAFTGRSLAPDSKAIALTDDGFERWVADRDEAQDRSDAARYIPRDVIGYQALDDQGTWSRDPVYGTVWYPHLTVADWAPYRYGHWESIAPWGWTWVDDALWGFAPFHYGRWAMVASRWCWVPGPLGPRPVYAPALVSFISGRGANIAWYPLGPGEVWRPAFETSPRYVREANQYLVSDSRDYNTGTPLFMRGTQAVTGMRIDDFQSGRPVQRSRTRESASDLANAQPALPPPVPQRPVQ